MKAFFQRGRHQSSSSQQPASQLTTQNAALDKLSLSLPPFPMPIPDRRLRIVHGEDGLRVIPVPVNATGGHTHKRTGSTGSAPYSAISAFIKWGRKSKVEAVSEVVTVPEGATSVECFGVVGLLRMFNASYLFIITRREHTGDFLHTSRPVYKCTGVLAIPLVKDAAEAVIKEEAKRAPVVAAEQEEEDEDDSDTDDVEDIEAEEEAATPSLLRRGSYFSTASSAATLRPADAAKWGRATQRSVSESGTVAQHPTVEQGDPVALPDSLNVTETPSATTPPSDAETEANKAELEDKLIKEAARQYARGEMFFAYDFDLTTSLQRKYQGVVQAGGKPGTTAPTGAPFEEPRATLPLWRRAERKFFHNEFMSKDFANAGLHNMVLPLMQGYFQTSALEIDASDATAQLVIVSRRSRERPGLRYQRRGINDAGQVANYVETEQILMVKREGQTHLFAFVQFRGSIPLFWSQSPFSMKPPPVLERSAQENATACSKHFQVQTERYGDVTCINLAEQGGKEGEITEAYRRVVVGLQNKKVHYHAFDFHKECAGMKFENVSRLIEIQKDRLEEMDCFWRAWGLDDANATGLMSSQKGAFRVSCLDCLDRTNVVQSAFGRHMLQAQFARLGIAPQQNPSLDYTFNDTWANNGDQISQCYAGSRALKGDFTRTGKRNLFGMMNDATASVYRMVQGAITDFWRQTVISYTYGELSLARLEKFSDDLQTSDPSNETRLARIRAIAIETCTSMVLDDPSIERKLAGWTLWSPLELNTLRSAKLEEKIVILSTKALYICAYDFTAEKFCEYTRVGLGDVVGLQKGAYVIAPRDGGKTDQHWGLVVRFRNQSTRVNSASVRNVLPEEQDQGTSFVALKVVADEFAGTLDLEQKGKRNTDTLRSQASLLTLTNDGLTSRQIVDRIVGMLVHECADAGACEEDGVGFVEEMSIQSLAEAKANASMFGGLIEGLKRRVWL